MKEMKKVWLIVPSAVVGVALLFAAVAFACTPVTSGNTAVSPTSGSHGTNVTLTCSASGIAVGTIAAGTKMKCYYLNPSSLHDEMGSCMGNAGQEVLVSNTAKAVQSDGTIPSVSGTINVGPAGSAFVCHIDSSYTYITNAATFTIT